MVLKTTTHRWCCSSQSTYKTLSPMVPVRFFSRHTGNQDRQHGWRRCSSSRSMRDKPRTTMREEITYCTHFHLPKQNRCTPVNPVESVCIRVNSNVGLECVTDMPVLVAYLGGSLQDHRLDRKRLSSSKRQTRSKDGGAKPRTCSLSADGRLVAEGIGRRTARPSPTIAISESR